MMSIIWHQSCKYNKHVLESELIFWGDPKDNEKIPWTLTNFKNNLFRHLTCVKQVSMMKNLLKCKYSTNISSMNVQIVFAFVSIRDEALSIMMNNVCTLENVLPATTPSLTHTILSLGSLHKTSKESKSHPEATIDVSILSAAKCC